MVYPSPYRAGMSSLGFQWIHRLLREAGLHPERVFLPDSPEAWRAARLAPISYETQTPLNRFPILAISLAYELEISGLLELLDLAGIPKLREDRGPHDPLILLGGPITMASPLVAAPFVDAMLLGEAEHTAPAAVNAAFDTDTRERWLDQLMADGVFVEDPGTTTIDAGVEIGRGTRILPHSHLGPDVRVGHDCVIGPHAFLREGVVVGDGDYVTVSSPGGGGYGNALQRPPEKVARDVEAGYYTAQEAQERFGVALDGAGQVDQAETEALRGSAVTR